MEINNIPDAFQTKLRLMVISMLITGEKTFREIKEITGASDGNISVQLAKLEELKYINIKKEFVGKKPKTTCKVTDFGRLQFEEYIEMLQNIINNSK